MTKELAPTYDDTKTLVLSPNTSHNSTPLHFWKGSQIATKAELFKLSPFLPLFPFYADTQT